MHICYQQRKPIIEVKNRYSLNLQNWEKTTVMLHAVYYLAILTHGEDGNLKKRRYKKIARSGDTIIHGILKHDTKENSERKRCGKGNIWHKTHYQAQSICSHTTS